eukprot:scaffold3408_cov98-Alexandrium_tamarense.AAC.4
MGQLSLTYVNGEGDLVGVVDASGTGALDIDNDSLHLLVYVVVVVLTEPVKGQMENAPVQFAASHIAISSERGDHIVQQGGSQTARQPQDCTAN